MEQLFLILLSASVAFALARLSSLPVIALLVLSGYVLQNLVHLPPHLLENSMELGLSFLLFSMGIELSPERFSNRLKTVTIIALVQILVVFFHGYLLASLLGYHLTASLLLSLSVTSSSTIAIISYLRKEGKLYEPFGRLVTGVLLIQDFLIIIALLYWQQWHAKVDPWVTTYAVFLLTALAFIAHMVVMPKIILYLQEKTEILLLVSLSVLFLFAGIAHFLSIPHLVGAFAAGFALSQFPVNGLVRAQLYSITDFFLAFFFVSVGAYIEIPSVKGILTVILFLLLLFLLTPLVVTITAERFHISTRSSMETGLLLSQAGELSLAAGLFAFTHGQIDRDLFSVIALITVISMALTPLVAREDITYFFMQKRTRLFQGEKIPPLENHVVLIGYGTVSRNLRNEILALKRPVVVIDDDPRVIRDLKNKNFIAINTDIRNKEAIKTLSLDKAFLIFSFARQVQDSLYLLHTLKGSRAKIVVRVFDKRAEKLVRSAGGIPVNASDIAIKHFIEWFSQNMARPRRKKTKART
ncbi:MAG: cation:proton antiporter [Leptospiraceae bacterium]|nr:cation:proton antiporter [Leptospiraceae bacterium]MDW8306431.1 cation:proton antiporter [Leptospiraceae bacterium]